MKNVITLAFICALIVATLPTEPAGADAVEDGNVTWTQWSFDNGEFVKNGSEWIVYRGGQFFARFRETERTAQSIYLYDDSRDLTVRLTATELHWRTADNDVWNYYCQGRAQ